MQDLLNATPELSTHVVAELVGQVYETAPPSVQCTLLEYLMRPLGVLALQSVGSGVFARIRFLSGRPDAPLGLQYLQEVCTDDVIALVDHVQQRCTDVLTGLVQLLERVIGYAQWRESSAGKALYMPPQAPGLP